MSLSAGRTMLRVVSALLVLLSAAAALGQDFEAGSFRREIESAVKDAAPERAVAALDRVLADATPRIRARHVEAARAAVDLLPWDVAAPRAARLLAEALKIDRTNQDGAWTAAQELRKELFRRVDVETGTRFLAKLIELYPDVAEYHRDRATLLLDGGRREEARAELEALFRMAPSDAWAGHKLAVMAEQDGRVYDPQDPKCAVAYWDRLAKARPHDLGPLLSKASVLARSKRHRTLARDALEEGRRAADATSNESVRAEYLERFAEIRADMDAEDERRDAIRMTEDRQRLAMGAAFAVWAVAAAFAAVATRASRPAAGAGASGAAGGSGA